MPTHSSSIFFCFWAFGLRQFLHVVNHVLIPGRSDVPEFAHQVQDRITLEVLALVRTREEIVVALLHGLINAMESGLDRHARRGALRRLRSQYFDALSLGALFHEELQRAVLSLVCFLWLLVLSIGADGAALGDGVSFDANLSGMNNVSFVCADLATQAFMIAGFPDGFERCGLCFVDLAGLASFGPKTLQQILSPLAADV